jgi:hypothetical protein
MKLSEPKQITFLVSLLVAIVAFLIAAGVITNPFTGVAVVWIALIAYVILAVGTLFRGL